MSGTVSVKSEGEGKLKRGMDKTLTVQDKKNNVTQKRKDSSGNNEILKHYNNIKEILDCSNATPIRCRGGIGYNCCFCHESFPDPADLKQHTIQHHEGIDNAYFKIKTDISAYHIKLDITGLQCTMCNINMNTLHDLIRHLIEAHERNIYTDIPNRIVPFKFDTEALQCYICFNNFTNFKILLMHMGEHIRNLICEICNAGFVYPKQLTCHYRVHKIGSYKCDQCPKVFNTLLKQKSHTKSVHIMKQQLNKCGYCGEMFKVYQQKIKHLMSVHGAKMTFKCTACDRTFWDRQAYRIHMRRDHLMERRHSCPECNERFYTTTTLKNHMLRHNGLKRFQCDVCLKRYGRKSTLREHLRIHANDRRFKCEHCGQSFVQKCSWRGHMRNKHGEDVVMD